MDDKPVKIEYCKHCFSIVMGGKMTEHWSALHKNVKAIDVRS